MGSEHNPHRRPLFITPHALAFFPQLSSLQALIAFSIFIPPPLRWAKQIKCAIKCIFTLCCCANDIMFCAWGWSRVSRLESTRKIHRGRNARQQLHAPFHGTLKAHLRIVAAKLDAAWDPGRFGHLNIFSQVLLITFIHRFQPWKPWRAPHKISVNVPTKVLKVPVYTFFYFTSCFPAAIRLWHARIWKKSVLYYIFLPTKLHNYGNH